MGIPMKTGSLNEISWPKLLLRVFFSPFQGEKARVFPCCFPLSQFELPEFLDGEDAIGL